MDCLKMLLIVIILIVRLGMIFNVQKLVTHMTPLQVHLNPNPPCTHTYHHISQQLNFLADSTQQQTLYTNEMDASLFTTDTTTPCTLNIISSDFHTMYMTILIITLAFTFGDAHIQYHDFDNGDAFIHKDKYTALLQQELKNPYWCLHDPITTQSFQISPDMDIKTMPHAMYFNGNASTVTKINHVPYQTIQYNNKGMFPAHLMDDTPKQVFVDNGATPFILPLSTYNKHPILQKYSTTKTLHPSTQELVQLSCIFG